MQDFYASVISKATEREGRFSSCVNNVSHPAWPGCTDYSDKLPDGQLIGEQSDHSTESWLMNTAGTLRRHLKYCYDHYPTRGGIYITEIGWAERDESKKMSKATQRQDLGRQRYFQDHLAAMLLSVYKDGVPLRGVYLWSATSNLEWELGTQARFGLQSVDFGSRELTRTYIGSFFLVRDFMRSHL